jgi:DnaJ-class molecular chaperone
MALPIDPSLRTGSSARVVAVQSPDLCAWCFGSGKILERMDCDTPHAYLPVVCERCAGTGRTHPR